MKPPAWRPLLRLLAVGALYIGLLLMIVDALLLMIWGIPYSVISIGIFSVAAMTLLLIQK